MQSFRDTSSDAWEREYAAAEAENAYLDATAPVLHQMFRSGGWKYRDLDAHDAKDLLYRLAREGYTLTRGDA